MKRGAKKAAGSPWRAALDRLAHARRLDWAGGTATEAAWEQVRRGEEDLLAAASGTAALADKLRYLLAVSQPPGQAALPPAEQPWRHRVLQSAIADAAALHDALETAQSECRRLRRARTGITASGRSAADVAAGIRAELAASLAERDAAIEALARQNLSVPLPAPVVVHGKARLLPLLSYPASRLLAIRGSHEGRGG